MKCLLCFIILLQASSQCAGQGIAHRRWSYFIEKTQVQSPAVGSDGTIYIGTCRLSLNYPNPFNPTTELQFTIANPQLTIVKVYDVLGRGIATLVQELPQPGTHTVEFDGSGLASGVYIYRLKAGDFVQSRKMVLMK